MKFLFYFFKLLFGIRKTNFKPKKAGSKDPDDHTKCELSTGWKVDDHYCSSCKKSTGWTQYMSRICKHCGEHGTQSRKRTYRKIWFNDKWQYQIRYNHLHTEEIIERWY